MNSLPRARPGSRRTLFLAGVSSVAIAVSSSASARPFGTWGVNTAATQVATDAAQVAAQQAQQAAQNSQQSLMRATRAIQALQAMQTQARNVSASAPSTIPNGLNVGGLVPDSGLKATGIANPVTTWVGANTPTQTTSGGKSTVNIDQTQPQALLNWQSFNVGTGTIVNFNQRGNASWAALNKIAAGASPSQILGSIKADGRVYLINQNGIIFGGTSQINVNTLIASTLDLDPSLTGSNYKAYLQGGLFQSSLPTGVTNGLNAAVFNQGNNGKIVVQPGAVIDTTGQVTSSGNGGYVALLADGGISNAGSITTQNGQIILASGGAVTLVTPTASVVGVKTAMQVLTGRSATPVAGSGVVRNETTGLLVSNDGAVTLAGGSISQLGAIVATTSTTRTGSIALSTLCQLGCGNGTDGNVVLGATSLTSILPDEASTTLPTSTVNSTTTANGTNGATAPYFQQVLQPQINISAQGNVDVQGSGAGLGGALIKAPGAALTISAGSGGTTNAVLLEPGSTIDLSGIAGVTLPMSTNLVTFKITAAEVADTPLAQGLIGQTVTIDLRLSGTRADGFQWVGSPILTAAGYAGLIPQSIDQILTRGGTLNTSAGNVIQQPGSVINVSAGYVQYLGGIINTTRLLGADGRTYNIGNANPNISYVVIANGFVVNHPRWNVTEVYVSPLGGSGAYYEAGYIAGANAGAVNVTASAPILEGDIVADVTAGKRQRAGLDPMPIGGSLGVSFVGNGGPSAYNVALEPQADAGPDPYGLSTFSFANASTWMPALTNGIFPLFSDVLSNASLNAISIKGASQLNMPTDAVLVVRPGGSITLDGVSTIDGVLSAPGGNISLTGFTYGAKTPPQQPPTPALVIGPNAVLDVHGLWVNDTGLSADRFQGPAYVNGGSVSIATVAASNGPSSEDGAFTDVTQSIVLTPGSVIDLSGGGYAGLTGKLKTGSDGLPIGKGGSLTLTTYLGGFPGRIAGNGQGTNPFNVVPHGTNPDGSVNHPNQANIILGATIYAGGFDGGGTLSLQVPTVVIDGTAGQVTSYLSGATANALADVAVSGIAVSDAKAGQLVLPPSFFTGAFSQYTLSDINGGTTVTAGTQLVLRQTNFLPTGHEMQIPTGTLVRSFVSVGQLLDGLRQPVGLTLNSQTGILVDTGSSIVTDPQATVTLNAAAIALSNGGTGTFAATTVLGSIVAPAGTINISGNGVRIGATADLDVSGTFVPNPQVVAYSTGTVLGGGTITLASTFVNATSDNVPVVVEPGARFDLRGAAVSAASNLIQLPQGGVAPRLVGQAAWSNGGSLQLLGTEVYFAGTVDASGGAPLASGGSLTIGNANNFPTAIVIESAGVVGANLPAPNGSLTPGVFIGADTLSGSGFDSVTLNTQTIAFAGSMNVAIPGALTLNASFGNIVLLPASSGLLPSGVDLSNSSNNFGLGSIPSIGGAVVNLDAGYVRVVGKTTPGTFAVPQVADGTLNISARWIDLQGAIALDNVVNTGFTSTSAIRLLPDNYGAIGSSNSSGRSTFVGALIVPGNLTLRATEIYPVSNTDFVLMSTGTQGSSSTITIVQNGVATAPLSAGGGIIVSAQNIVQNGTLWAPLGSIVLGVTDASQVPAGFGNISGLIGAGNLFVTGAFAPTKNVTLGTGSLTSVSAAGLAIPDGYTVDDTTWYRGTSGNANVPPVLTAPPAKSISLFGTTVTTSSGAVLDLSGGGDIYATEYVAGTGGTRNVLTTYQQNPATAAITPTYSDGRQVYALVPSYLANVAAYDPNFADTPYYSGTAVPSGASVPYANAISPGQSVTIAGGNGIPAGTYTLLPGMYATLPGAYRVVQVANNVNPGAAKSFTSPDGSQYVTGTLGNSLTGAQSSQSATFQLQSQAVWSRYSRIDITSGTTFFRNQALAAGKAPPPLPIDGGGTAGH